MREDNSGPPRLEGEALNEGHLQSSLTSEPTSLASATTDADSLGTLSSCTDSLASTASTVSMKSTAQPGGQADPMHGDLLAGPEFSWESSYAGNALFAAAWRTVRAAQGSTLAQAARDYPSTTRGAPGGGKDVEYSSQVGPMGRRQATGTLQPPSQALCSASSRRLLHRHQPYARPGPAPLRSAGWEPPANASGLLLGPTASTFDDLRSFNYVVSEGVEPAPPDPHSVARQCDEKLASISTAAETPRQMRYGSGTGEEGLTMGPGEPPGWSSHPFGAPSSSSS